MAEPPDPPSVRRFAPGTFHSPLPSIEEVERFAQIVHPERRDCPGVDLRERAQVALLEELAPFQAELPFTEENLGVRRYYGRNVPFPGGDAILAYSMLRRFRPRRIVEIGSGFSSAAMLDVDELFLGGATQFTFIEPLPDRLMALLRAEDRARATILVKPVQDVPLTLFESLEENDLLFVDSSHVSKLGSDVNRIFFEILPALRPGVLVHFHDVFWPFEYHEDWMREGYAWNEAYLLRAFLSFNARFELLLFLDWLKRHEREAVERTIPLLLRYDAGSLWLRKV